MTNNQLKIIAIITMIIDHIGYYFLSYINYNLYLTFRIVGRIAMPIFTFLIVEGYFHTTNLKKYILRLGFLAVLTQGILMIIEIFFCRDGGFGVSSKLNIIFSFIIILLFIFLFENILRQNNLKNKMLLSIYLVFVVVINELIGFDYELYTIALGIFMYFTKKYIKNEILYKICLSILIIIISLLLGSTKTFAIFSIPFILLYNGKLGVKSKVLKYLFYFIFPLQHVILYSTYLIIS